MTRPSTSGINSLSVRGATVPWVKALRLTVCMAMGRVRTRGAKTSVGLEVSLGPVAKSTTARPTPKTRITMGSIKRFNQQTPIRVLNWALQPSDDEFS